MTSTIWTTTLGHKYADVIDQLERALRNCPDELWEESLWEVKRTHRSVWPVRRIDAKLSTAKSQEPLLQVYSAFWNIAYHALFHLDFYLSGGSLKGFAPPPPFREDEHRAHVIPNRAYARDELQTYVEYNREKARTVIGALTDEQAERMLSRMAQPFASLLFNNMLHAQEHAAQLHLFLGQRGVEPPDGAGADEARQLLRRAVRGRSDAEIDAFAKSLGGYDRLLARVFAGFAATINPQEPCAVHFDVGSTYVIHVSPGSAKVDKSVPAKVDAVVTVSPQDFLRWMTRSLDRASAIADGRIKIKGDADILWRQLANQPADA